MTVIVFDGKSLAVDRSATAGTLMHHMKKTWVIKAPHNVLLTGFGPAAGVIHLKNQFQSKWGGINSRHKVEGYPAHLEPAQLVTLNSAGILRVRDSNGYVRLETTRSVAFGEGADLAYGVLFAGGSAHTAALAACEYNIHCGGGIDVYKIMDSGGFKHTAFGTTEVGTTSPNVI